MAGINECMMDLIEEMTDPSEVMLNEDVEDEIENETNAICSMYEDEDELIEFIDKGARIGYEEPIDFSDDDDDDDLDDDVDGIADDTMWED